jgi:hypothetical protein
LKLLKLKANEIELFLQFCEADPKSKTIAANYNTLSYDGFCSKNTEFKKLGNLPKNNLLFIPLNELTTIYSTADTSIQHS